DYTPANCKWSTDIEQHNNTSLNVVIDGLTLSQHARANNMSIECLRARMMRGATFKEAISKQPRAYHKTKAKPSRAK
ncbi:MAG: hypothetical protein DRP45_10315, partial [Candidatus Zixiibacteriota bacterium]